MKKHKDANATSDGGAQENGNVLTFVWRTKYTGGLTVDMSMAHLCP
jgi:hypothetical protein